MFQLDFFNILCLLAVFYYCVENVDFVVYFVLVIIPRNKSAMTANQGCGSGSISGSGFNRVSAYG